MKIKETETIETTKKQNEKTKKAVLKISNKNKLTQIKNVSPKTKKLKEKENKPTYLLIFVKGFYHHLPNLPCLVLRFLHCDCYLPKEVLGYENFLLFYILYFCISIIFFLTY